MSEKQKQVDWPTCQLMLVIEPGAGARERLRAAFEVCQASAVLIRPKAGQKLGAGEVKPLVDLSQDQGAAAILMDDAELARTLRADGVHLAPDSQASPVTSQQIAAARAVLGADAIIGVEAGQSRHAAMEAGETGASYVAFGVDQRTDRQTRDDMVAWWAEIFEVPCVVLDVDTVAEASRGNADGADFVALTLPEDLDALGTLVGDVDCVLMLGGETAEGAR